MKRFCSPLLWPTVLFVCLCSGGCKESEELKTIKGLQEENKVLSKKSDDLEKSKSANQLEWEGQIDRLKKSHEDSLARERELHRTQAAQFEKEIATLRLELGSSQREKIALQEIVDREPRIKDATASRMGTDVWVLALLLGATLIVLAFVAFRYRTVSDRLNFLTMQQVGELRRIGGEA